MSAALFSATYREARQRFLAAAHAAGATVESHVHPLPGAEGEPIATDTALVGPADAGGLLIVSSGTHGPEGFAGSAISCVVVGVLLVVFTHNPRLDSVLAALVAMNVLWSGWGVIRENVSGLMDEAAPPEELGRIREIISTNATGSLEAHALRTRHAGKVIFVDFHLVVVASMTVGEAADRVIERVSGFQVAAGDPVRTTVVARLAGGAPAAANLDSFAGVERAVRAVFNSPLMFLR